MPRPKSVKNIVRELSTPKVTEDIAGNFIIPNHSGATKTPQNDKDIANKKYVDDNSGVGTWTDTSTNTGTNKTLDDFSNLIEADQVHLKVRNESGSDMTREQLVYISGYNLGLDRVLVSLADANGGGTFPAIGILDEDIGLNQDGHCTVQGRFTDLNTSAFSVGDSVYMSETPGEISTKPTNAASQVQAVGIVLRSNINNGVLEITGAGRTNDSPNTINVPGDITGANIITAGLVDGIDVGTDVAANTTHRGDNSQAHTDYLINTGDDTKLGDLELDSPSGTDVNLSLDITSGTTNTANLNFKEAGAIRASIQYQQLANKLVIDGHNTVDILNPTNITGDTDVDGYITTESGTAARTFVLGSEAGKARLQRSAAGDAFRFLSASDANIMALLDDGKVGIGTTSPSSKLDVNGTITADKAKINGNVVVTDEIKQSSVTIKKIFEKTAITDNTATGIFRVNTTNEPGDGDGGVYSVHVQALVSHVGVAAAGFSASKGFIGHFVRQMPNTGSGVNSAVTEISETASAANIPGNRDIGTITMTVVENTEYQNDVKFTIDLTGTSVASAEIICIVTLIWNGFITEPTITAL